MTVVLPRSGKLLGVCLAAVAFTVMLFTELAFGNSAKGQDCGRRRGGPRVIQLDEIRIEGRVQKPNAFYILNRSNLGYEVLDLRTSFLHEIVRTVDEEPF